MLLPEARPTRWDLHWRMFGSEVRIRPVFWASCVLLGILFYRDPDIGGLAMFWAWVATVLLTLLAHETGHVLAARLLGARLRIVLSGLGGQVHGLEERKVWQRVLILLTGSMGNGLLLGILWAITNPQWNPLPIHRIGPEWTIFIANVVYIAWLMNIFWIVLNVLPLWPLDGGRAAVEIGGALLGRRGQTLALLASLVVCLLLSLWIAQWARLKLNNRFDPGYPIYLFYVCTLVLYCYFLWVSAFRALWGDPVPIDESNKSGRAA